MQGGGGEVVLPVLRAPDNAADAVPTEQILNYYLNFHAGAKLFLNRHSGFCFQFLSFCLFHCFR